MANPLLEALGFVGNVLDTPGAFARTALAGRNPLPGVFDPEQRATGRDLLEQWGILDPNTEGFDAGDVGGFLTEMLLDPLNLVGGLGLAKAAKARGLANAQNLIRETKMARGAMPSEVAALTKAVDEFGAPVRTYHGTPNVFEQYDPERFDPDALFGPGIYTTQNPEVASSYTPKGAKGTIRRDPAATDADIAALMRGPGERHGFYVSPGPEELPDADAALALQAENLAKSLYPALHVRLGRGDDEFIEGLGKFFTAGPPPENVRMQYLDVRNPFDIDAPVPRHQAVDIAERAGLIDMPEFDFLGRPVSPPGEVLWGALEEIIGKPSATNALRTAGFDAITHMGGGRAGGGNVMHRVWIPFDPSQVYGPWIAPAAREVPRVSPLLGALGGYNVGARAPDRLGGV